MSHSSDIQTEIERQNPCPILVEKLKINGSPPTGCILLSSFRKGMLKADHYGVGCGFKFCVISVKRKTNITWLQNRALRKKKKREEENER